MSYESDAYERHCGYDREPDPWHVYWGEAHGARVRWWAGPLPDHGYLVCDEAGAGRAVADLRDLGIACALQGPDDTGDPVLS